VKSANFFGGGTDVKPARARAPFEKPDSGWCGDRTRGASMGRATVTIPNGARVHLRRVPARDGGDYDPGGAYWGNIGGSWYCGNWRPAPLWCAWTDYGEVMWIRAGDRAQAKAELTSKGVKGLRYYR
jgi:hypothetical protein